MKSRIKVLLFFSGETGCNGIKTYGVCGKETDLIDINGDKLYVGDVVQFTNTSGEEVRGYVVENKNEAFIMGLHGLTSIELLQEWHVERIKSYADTINNEQYGRIVTKFKKQHTLCYNSERA